MNQALSLQELTDRLVRVENEVTTLRKELARYLFTGSWEPGEIEASHSYGPEG